MGWLESYVHYAKNNEAADAFHWWVGATMLGAALKNQVYFQRGYFKTFPNLWTMLVARSGTKKTTACTIGHALLSKLEHVNILADKASPEGLLAELGTEDSTELIESQGLIYAPELVVFLDRRLHNDGLSQILLRMADCPSAWRYKTKSSGEIFLRNVVVSFLAATTESLLKDSIPVMALKSGFLARYIPIALPENYTPKVIAFPWSDATEEISVFNKLYELSHLQGSMEFPKPVFDWYHMWYMHYKTQEYPKVSNRMQAFAERLPEHLIRLGMLCAISDTGKLCFTIDAFEKALKILKQVVVCLDPLFSTLEETSVGVDQHGILGQLRASGGTMQHSLLMRKNSRKFTGDTFKKYISTLIEGDYIRATRSKTGARVYTLLT